MGNTDSFPVISQAKSLVQVIAGDAEGARRTQNNFLYKNTFPVLSQVCSLGHVIAGDTKEAGNVQKHFAKDMMRALDSIPISGHINGGIHHAMGDHEVGNEAFKASSRSSGVVLGGLGGFAVGGPVGAVIGGIAGGAAADGIITGAEYAANGEDAKPYGYVKRIIDIDTKISNGESVPVEDIAELTLMPVLDGFGGRKAGNYIAKPMGLGVKPKPSVTMPADPSFRGANVRED
jgi:hypothetical protein